MSGRPKYKLKTTKVEKSVVEAYQKIEDKFVDTFLEEVTDENENDNENGASLN